MQTAQLILKHPDFQTAEMCYVSVYTKNEVYGGPEEGGWWHTVYALQGSLRFATRQQAEAYVEQAEQQAQQLQLQASREFQEHYVSRYQDASADIEDDFCRGEVASSDEYVVIIEEIQGSYDNTKEPIGHWE